MTDRTMDLESEAKAFAARKDRRKAHLPGRRQDIEASTAKQTLKKLQEVRADLWREKVITSDPKREAMLVEVIADTDLKIADYENQVEVMNERDRFGRGKQTPHR